MTPRTAKNCICRERRSLQIRHRVEMRKTKKNLCVESAEYRLMPVLVGRTPLAPIVAAVTRSCENRQVQIESALVRPSDRELSHLSDSDDGTVIEPLPDRQATVLDKLRCCQSVLHSDHVDDMYRKSSRVENHANRITKFLNEAMSAHCKAEGCSTSEASSMYVCGGPGTGKVRPSFYCLFCQYLKICRRLSFICFSSRTRFFSPIVLIAAAPVFSPRRASSDHHSE